MNSEMKWQGASGKQYEYIFCACLIIRIMSFAVFNTTKVMAWYISLVYYIYFTYCRPFDPTEPHAKTWLKHY